MPRVNFKFFKKLFIICFLLGLAGAALVLLINYRVNAVARNAMYHNVSEIDNADVALVLGTSRYLSNGYENEYFKKRIEAAAQLYYAHKVKKILVSGDNHVTGYDEPTDMRNALIEKGVPEKDIVLDYAGFRTYDSMVRARDVFGLHRFIVVSQEFHCARAIYIAHAKGMEVQAYVALDPSTPSSKTVLREYPARVSAFLDCYLLHTHPHFLGDPINITAGL